jgi:hypothetical protein
MSRATKSLPLRCLGYQSIPRGLDNYRRSLGDYVPAPQSKYSAKFSNLNARLVEEK